MTLVERERRLGGWVARLRPDVPARPRGPRADRRPRRRGPRSGRRSPCSPAPSSSASPAASATTGSARGSAATGAGTIEVAVGSIVVATGLRRATSPGDGEFGYGIDGVVTLPEFKALVDGADRAADRLERPAGPQRRLRLLRRQPQHGGLRQRATARGSAARPPCRPPSRSRASTRRSASSTSTATCGPTASSSRSTPRRATRGSVFLKFDNDEPPAVARSAGRALTVTVRDLLTERDGARDPGRPRRARHRHGPARERGAGRTCSSCPTGSDGFFNEIHPKLRPVETVVDGVLIAGACQGPEDLERERHVGLAAVTQSAAVLKKGFAELDPLVAIVDPDACTALRRLPHGLPVRRDLDGRGGRPPLRGHQPDGLQGLRRLRADLPGERDRPARLHRCPDHLDDRRASWRCPSDACHDRDAREVIREEPVMRPRILAALAAGPLTVPEIAEAIGAPSHEVVFWVMGMRRYGWLAEIKGSTATATSATRRRDGPPDDRHHVPATAPASARPRALPRPPALRRDRRLRLLLVRHLHRDLPDGRRPTARSRAGSSATRSSGMKDALLSQQGAVGLLPVRRVRRDVPDAGGPVRVHGGGSALRDRELRPDAASRARCTRGPSSATVLAVLIAAPLRAVHVRRARAA